MAKLFISYRRDDTGPFTHRLAASLKQSLGETAVFLDLDRIRVGDRWQKSIEEALDEATLLIPIIGSSWLKLQDVHGRRRLDTAADWVRLEIESAIRRGINILPVTVDGAQLPPCEALPSEIAELIKFQGYAFNSTYFQRDFDDLFSRITEFGFHSAFQPDYMPPRADNSPALSQRDIETVLRSLPNWTLQTNRPTPNGDGNRMELFRHFVFGSFPDAIHFMMTASRHAHIADHHPEWLNLWVNVKVWLTTWDIGFRPTYKDIRQAEYLENLFQDYTKGGEGGRADSLVFPNDTRKQ